MENSTSSKMNTKELIIMLLRENEGLEELNKCLLEMLDEADKKIDKKINKKGDYDAEAHAACYPFM